MTGPVFEFSEVFDEDYLYFYAPHLEAVSDTADVDFFMCVACGHIWSVSRDGLNSIRHISTRKPPAARDA